MLSPAHATLSLVVLAAGLSAAPQGPAPGFRVYGPHGTNDTYMIDTAGNVVHTWPSSYNPGNGLYLEADGTLIRSGQVAGAPPIGGRGGAVQRVAFDGTILWDYHYTGSTHWAHHDIEPMPNGNVLMIAWDLMTASDAVAEGRDPALIAAGTPWMPDSIVEIQQTGPNTGNVVWEWHVRDHLVQDFDNTKPNFGVVADHSELLDINFPVTTLTRGDWNHANSVAYDPVRDLIVINFAFQDEFYLLDHSTTSAEAAGHSGGTHGVGGDFLYRWGNPQAYRAGSPTDQKLFLPHATYIIPQGLPGAGNILGFNNNAGTQVGQNYSAVFELQLPALTPPQSGQPWGPTGLLWEYTAPNKTNFYSSGLSNAERLPNGNTLICSGRQGWLFEVDANKQKVWEHYNQLPSPTALVFQVSYYERYLWADAEQLPAATGGTIDFDLVAGSAHAGDIYLMLGSLSGTVPGINVGPLNLPLNPDAYLFFAATAAGGPILPTFLGTLDGTGNGAAQLTLPRLPTLVGTTLHHAFAVVDPTNLQLLHTSNAVPLALVP